MASAPRGAGAARFALPSRVRGMSGVGWFSHWPDPNAPANTIPSTSSRHGERVYLRSCGSRALLPVVDLVTVQAPSRSSTTAHRAVEGGQRMRESLLIPSAPTREVRRPRGPHSICPVPHEARARMRMPQAPAGVRALVRDAVTAPDALASPSSSSSSGTERARLRSRGEKLGERALRCQSHSPRCRQLPRGFM